MKKFLSFIAVLLCCAAMSFAQTNFVATLSHAGEFSHYYGANALLSAYEEAVDGDIITLSPGTFQFPKFNKGVTVRGAGIDAEEKTYISNGNVKLYSTDSTHVATIEGIVFNNNVIVYNDNSGNGQGTIKFIKCNFNSLEANVADSYSTAKGPAVRLYNVVVTSSMYFANVNCHPDFIFCNSYVAHPYSASEYTDGSYTYIDDNTSAFVNCVIEYNDRYYGDRAYYLNFFNCIFNWTDGYSSGSSTSYILPNTTTCYNCLSINKSTLFNKIVSGINNSYIDSASEVFKTYTSGYTYGETFELKDAIKAQYLGTDGKELGMHGGNYSYTTTVQYPIITKFAADASTTKEGKLSIDVEVDGK
jgi:hypothetical protein